MRKDPGLRPKAHVGEREDARFGATFRRGAGARRGAARDCSSPVDLRDEVQAQSLTIDPESIVPLPDKFDMETPAPDVPPEMAAFTARGSGPCTTAGISSWLSASHLMGMRTRFSQKRPVTMTGFRIFRYAFDGPDRSYLTATNRNLAASPPEH
jgi:hypothetical protein